MNLSTEQLMELSKLGIEAAKEAGRMIASHADQAVSFEKKETGASLASQVVTEVDCKSQDIVLKHLRPTCSTFDIGMLAEESEDDLSRFEKDYFWCVDPMDGTLPFIEKREGYAVSIGLVSKGGVPTIGIVYDPLKHILYHAVKGVGLFRNHEPWNPKLTSDKAHEPLDRGGAVMNACWVLENTPSYFHKNPKVQNGGGCVWDYAATACLFETVGAWVSDMHGDPLELNRRELPYMNHKGILFASNEAVARQVMADLWLRE